MSYIILSSFIFDIVQFVCALACTLFRFTAECLECFLSLLTDRPIGSVFLRLVSIYEWCCRFVWNKSFRIFYSYLEVAYFHVFIGSLSTQVVYTNLAYLVAAVFYRRC